MKVRNIVAVGALLAMLVPTAGRADHCEIPIYLFSTTRIQTDVDDPTNPGGKIGRTLPSATSTAIGCTVIRDTVIGGEDPALHDIYDTNWIYPGANRLQARFFPNGFASTTVPDPSIVSSAVMTFAGETYTLNLQTTTTVLGDPAGFLDSQTFTIDPALTLAPNTAVIDICTTEGECFHQEYRTLTA
jgi:hypothetical protein